MVDLSQLRLLKNKKVIKWCYEGLFDVSLKNTSNSDMLKPFAEKERIWGNEILNNKKINTQWTTKFCEEIVKEALIALERGNVSKITKIDSSLERKQYDPDLKCDKFVYEVKGRSWSTTGTAGEKILGVPVKYGELPELIGKPLQIILVGYQEYEARHGFACGNLLDLGEQTEELKSTLEFYKSMNIEYIAFTDILRELGLKPD